MQKTILNNPFDVMQFLEETFKQAANGKMPQRNNVLAVDVIENEQQYTVYANVAGASKDNISIEFNKGNLTIDVKAKQEFSQEDKLLINERRNYHKTRSLQFGENVDSDLIKASYQDGVLSLVIPKKEASDSSKKITID